MTHRPITVLAVGGTTESYSGDTRHFVTGLLSYVTTHLDDRFEPEWVGYPASYGPIPAYDGDAYLRSVKEGAAALAHRVAVVPHPVYLLGYSQGCAVVRQLLDEIAHGGHRDLVLLGAGLIADPAMPKGAAHGKPDIPGWGVIGEGGLVPDGLDVMWLADENDPIPAASGDSLWRDVADLSGFFGIRSLPEWGLDLRSRITERRWQNAYGQNPFDFGAIARMKRRVDTALTEIACYLPRIPLPGAGYLNPRGGRHTAYATDPYLPGSPATACDVLAAHINRSVY